MPGEHKLPLGVSVATFASAAIAFGILYNRVDVVADDLEKIESKAIPERLAAYESDMSNVKEDISDIKAEQKEQRTILNKIAQKVGADP